MIFFCTVNNSNSTEPQKNVCQQILVRDIIVNYYQIQTQYVEPKNVRSNPSDAPMDVDQPMGVDEPMEVDEDDSASWTLDIER